MQINEENGTDGRSVERGKIGEREATGFQNICNVSVRNSFATGDHSKQQRHQKQVNTPAHGEMYSLGNEGNTHTHAITHF